MANRRVSHKTSRHRKNNEISIQKTEFVLNSYNKMPSFGVAIDRLLSDDAVNTVVDRALKEGYRLFDTCPKYGNEQRLKVALKELLPKYELKRSDVFITCQLNPHDFGDEARTEKSFFKSYHNLECEYIDLYLVKIPKRNKESTDFSKNNKRLESTWSKLVELYDDGKVNALGVSNFSVRMLQDLAICDHGVTPAVNKVEWHPYYSEKDLYCYCKENNILIQAYSTMECQNGVKMLNDRVIVNMAKELDVTPPELIFCWTLQRDVAIIPRTVCAQNLHIDAIPKQFTISPNNMRLLNVLAENYAWTDK